MSAYSNRGLSSPLSDTSRRFVTRAHVGDDILDMCGLLVALCTLQALCSIIHVMFSLMVSMSSIF